MTTRGMVWFVTSDGLSVFHPDLEYHEVPVPPIYISKLQVAGKAVNFHNVLEFAYDQNTCVFDFIGISFRDERAIRYRYRLLGAEDDWQPITSLNSVTYAGLNPGTYTFAVKAINLYDVESAEPATLTFTIVPPYWQRWWFISASVVALGFILFAGYRYRVRRLLEVERLRTRMAADLHDELASNLSSIAMFSKIIQQESRSSESPGSESNKLLERISVLSQESVAAIRDIIWAIDPRPEGLSSLLLRFRDSIVGPCRAKKISLNYILPPKEALPTKDLSPERRRNLWLLLKEAVNNSLKHSECTELSIEIGYNSGSLRITIHDDGSGFDSSQRRTGKGLSTMEMRARQMNGSIQITSPPGHGTTASIQLELG